jgi:hypothetical protein
LDVDATPAGSNSEAADWPMSKTRLAYVERYCWYMEMCGNKVGTKSGCLGSADGRPVE